MIGRSRAGLTSPVNYPADNSFFAYPSDHYIGKGTRRVLVGCHGHGNYGHSYAPVTSSQPGVHTAHLVDVGNYVVEGIDHSQINAWGDPGAMVAMDDNYAYLTSTFLMPSAKIGIIGYSMGGTTALNWALRNPTKVAGVWLFNPATDLRWFHDAAGAYTPTYATSPAAAAQALYTAELDTTYAATTTHTTTGTIPASGGAGITLTVANAREFSDANVLGGTALPQATVNGVAFTYTGKTATTLIGCVSTTGSTIAVTSGQTITSVYATQYPAYSPWQKASAFSTANGITFPIKIQQATDDTVVAPGQNLEAVNGFIARAGNTNITARTPAVTGGHGASIEAVPSSEIRAFFDGLTW